MERVITSASSRAGTTATTSGQTSGGQRGVVIRSRQVQKPVSVRPIQIAATSHGSQIMGSSRLRNQFRHRAPLQDKAGRITQST
jgi:hypothetical protein